MEWYYAESGQRLGPISEADLQSLYVAGRIRSDTLVWKAGMAEWQPFSSARPYPPGMPVAAGQFCTECGKQYESNNLLTFGAARVCAGCKDVFFQRVREQGSAVATERAFLLYAGFWIRVLARLIDGLILGVFFVVLFLLAFGTMGRGALRNIQVNAPISSSSIALFYGVMALVYLVAVAASLIYESWFVGNRGGTPGKLALGLRVVRSDGVALSQGRSVGRAFAYILDNLIPLGLGFIIAGFDNEKRTLHDHIADTRVIHRAA